MYVVAIMGTMGGIVGFHARQVPSYGRLGTTGFLAAFMGTAVLLLGIVFSFVVGSASTPAFLGKSVGSSPLVTKRSYEEASLWKKARYALAWPADRLWTSLLG